jgi:hypothetical protein
VIKRAHRIKPAGVGVVLAQQDEVLVLGVDGRGGDLCVAVGVELVQVE